MSQLSLWRQLTHAAALLQSGHPVAMPTETVYGLAAPIDNPQAIEKIFTLKERPFFDPLIVHVSRIEDVRLVAKDLCGAARALGNAFWPGPLTLVLPRRDDLNPMICAGLDTVGVRIPNHPLARRLIRKAGPLAAPSANKFGKTSPTTVQHVRAEWSEADLFALEGAQSTIGIESTVIRVNESHENVRVEILRPGFIGESEVLKALDGYSKPVEVVRLESNLSPGHTPEHYQPKIPLVFVSEGSFPLSAEQVKKVRDHFRLSGVKYAEVLLNANPAVAARELYSQLHDLATGGTDFLVVVSKPHQRGDLWDAIWDRLDRAASLRV
ncbi:MAG: L-threonylcarbamoyladenylate synthase [Bdellovibrionota bacterium]